MAKPLNLYIPRYYDTCPEWVPLESDGRRIGEPGIAPLGLYATNKGGKPLWGGRLTVPPPLGTCMRVPRLGPGIVAAYFTWNHYLGLHLWLHEPPEWYVRNYAPDSYRAHIFGIEFDYCTIIQEVSPNEAESETHAIRRLS